MRLPQRGRSMITSNMSSRMASLFALLLFTRVRHSQVVRGGTSANTRDVVEKIMVLHFIKLSVGTDSVQDLEDWIKKKLKERKARGQKIERVHTTRMVPKRVDELLDGGSIYWVIRGEILCRERILDIRPFVDRDGIGRCHLVLDPKC